MLHWSRGRRHSDADDKMSLTARMRVLYEHSAVPVAEIAWLTGVSERTIYKYAPKGNGRRAIAGRPPIRAAWRADKSVALVKGAAGRLSAASTRAGLSRAASRRPMRLRPSAPAPLARRAPLSRALHREKARPRQFCQAPIGAIDAANGAVREFNSYDAERCKGRRRARHDDALARVLWRAVDVAVQRWEWLLAEHERAAG